MSLSFRRVSSTEWMQKRPLHRRHWWHHHRCLNRLRHQNPKRTEQFAGDYWARMMHQNSTLYRVQQIDFPRRRMLSWLEPIQLEWLCGDWLIRHLDHQDRWCCQPPISGVGLQTRQKQSNWTKRFHQHQEEKLQLMPHWIDQRDSLHSSILSEDRHHQILPATKP